MRIKLDKTPLIIFATFLIALLLSILPLPEWAQWLAPHWMLLVLIYWILALPHRVNLSYAFIAGIFMDLLNGTLFGEHALAFLIVAYMTLRLHKQIRVFPMTQQAITIFIMLLFYQAVLFWVQGIIGNPIGSLWIWFTCLSSVLLWPWVFNVLRDCRRKFGLK